MSVINECPNWSLESNKKLVDALGKGTALAALTLNDNKSMSVEEARELLGKLPKGDKYSNIQLSESQYENFSHISDFGERYTAIANRKSELQNQGAQISGLDANGFRWIPAQSYKQKSDNTTAKTEPDNKLDKAVGKFLKSIGVSVEHIPNTAQDFNAIVDTLNKTIRIVEGKAQIDTLGHEATHQYLDLLPPDSKLLNDILSDVRNRDEYEQIYEHYKNDANYRNGDQVDETMIAKETAAHIIDNIIVGKHQDKKAMKWWERLWNWITNLAKNVREKLGGEINEETMSPYEQVAEDILENKISKLDLSKAREANLRGEVYKQLDEESRLRVEKMRLKGTDKQKAIIDGFLLRQHNEDLDKFGIKPAEEVTLNPIDHTYTGASGESYISTTRKISGQFDEEKQALFEKNKQAGIDVDNLLQAAVEGRTHKDIAGLETPMLGDEIKTDLFSLCKELVKNLSADGSMVFTQVITSDPVSKTAGSKDLWVVHPDGSSTIIDLKTSVNKVLDAKGKKDQSLSKTYTSLWEQNPGSVFNDLVFDKTQAKMVPKKPEQSPVKLSKKLQHAVQVGSYAKMDELQGIPVNELKTWNINIAIQQKEDGSYYVKDFKNEGFIDHLSDNNTPYIDAVIPTEPGEPSALQQEVEGAQIPDEDPTVIPEQPDPIELEKLNHILSGTLDKAIEDFTKRKASALDTTRHTSINELKNLVIDINNLKDQNDLQGAMMKVVNYVKDLTNNSIKFLDNKNNFKNREYFRFLQEAVTLGGANDLLLPAKIKPLLTPVQQSIFDSTKNKIADLQELSTIRANGYVVYSNTPDSVDPAAIRELLLSDTPIEDISITGSWGSPQDELRNPFIRKAEYVVEKAKKEEDLKNVEHTNKWIDIGNKFAVVAGDQIKQKGFWNFMYKMRDGKPVSYIAPIGDKYNDLKDQYQSMKLDDQGEYKKYIQIRQLDGAKQEDIDFNTRLYKEKQAIRKFEEAERLNKDGEIVDGKYHHYSEDYVQARDKVMLPNIVTDLEGNPRFIEWHLREGLSEDSSEVKQFRNKYQVRDRYESMEVKKGEPTGVVKEKEGYFPNNDYVIPNTFAHDLKTGKKEDMRDPDYVKLMNPQNDLEVAQRDFYNAFIEDYVKINELSGNEVQGMINDLPLMTINAKVFQTAAKTGTINWIKHQGIEFFTALRTDPIEKTDAEGVTRMQLRIPSFGNLRSQEKIADIEKQIADLIGKQSSISKKEFNEQKKELDKKLQAESHKLAPEDIELDPVKQMIVYGCAMNHYDSMKNVEGNVLALKWAMENQKYIKTKNGVVVRNPDGTPVYKHPDELNVNRAMGQFLKNFYGITLDETDLGVIVKRFQNLTSVGVMGLNLFNQFKNLLVYQVNIASQAYAGKFGLSGKNRLAAIKLLTTTYIPGMAKSKLEKAGKYGGKVPQNWIEAAHKHYNISVDNVKTEGGLSGIVGKLYFGENIAVDLAQVALMINCFKDFTIKNYNTGDMVSLENAHTFDPKTGKYELRDGFKLDDVLYRLVKINHIQTQVQGNYNPITQTAMSHNLLGAILLQFHRFLPTSINNRFSKKYTHETLGETEGTWRSALSLIKLLKDYDGKWQDAFDKKSEFWKNTPDYIKQNLLFDALDVIRFTIMFAVCAWLKGVIQGMSDDHPTQKRWANYIAYTMDSLKFDEQMFIPGLGIQQMAEFAKNPVALTGTLQTFAQALVLSAQYPFQTDDERYYKRGVFKGQSKAAHQIAKMIPLWREINRWTSFSQLQTQEGALLGANRK